MVEKATFAAGCFWGVQLEFDKVDGVISTVVGYIGGHKDAPTYEQVCEDNTGHAEAVEIEYDPNQVSYEKLLEIFWQRHDPTTLNSQGPDFGTQYRSGVFYHNEDQRSAAEELKSKLDHAGAYSKPIVTEIVAASKFWPAEEYHQKYLEKKGITISCH